MSSNSSHIRTTRITIKALSRTSKRCISSKTQQGPIIRSQQTRLPRCFTSSTLNACSTHKKTSWQPGPQRPVQEHRPPSLPRQQDERTTAYPLSIHGHMPKRRGQHAPAILEPKRRIGERCTHAPQWKKDSSASGHSLFSEATWTTISRGEEKMCEVPPVVIPSNSHIRVNACGFSRSNPRRGDLQAQTT